MGMEEELESDIKRALEQLSVQNKNDREETLRLLLDKYIHLSKSTFLIDTGDLSEIINFAKSSYAQRSFPVHMRNISGRVIKVNQNDQANLCVIESTIGFLNKHDCLKKSPRIKYADDKYED